jgi:hypothetical protein
MSLVRKELPVLMLECGSFLIGVDADTIRNVGPSTSEEAKKAEDIGRLLGKQQTASNPRQRRSFAVTEGDLERWMTADRLLGIYAVQVDDMHRVPSALRNFQGPSWLMGFTWVNDRLVLLVDLVHLNPEHSGSDSP